MIELKPCPFCGGEARIEHDDDGSAYLEVDHRPDCFLTYRDTLRWFYPAKGDMSADEHAASEWNRRAERTCHMEPTELGEWRCSECGYLQKSAYRGDKGWMLPRYCQVCGAKVVTDGD